jgi:hypothetical protein
VNEKSKNTIPNIWAAQENLIHLYKVFSSGIGVLAFVLLMVAGVLAFRDPIVVVRSTAGQEFYPSTRRPVSIEKNDVENITRRFLTALYVWAEFNGQVLAKDITPYTEEALVGKIIESQSAKYAKVFKGKKLEQEISFVKLNVLDDRVVCSFDRILKVEGVPLVIQTELTLSMLQGNPTQQNPMGVFVSGIFENEAAK